MDTAFPVWNPDLKWRILSTFTIAIEGINERYHDELNAA
jgi:hypothetical protein